MEAVSGKPYGEPQIYRAPDLDPPIGGASKPWKFGEAESKRKRRIARYQSYTVEGKVKASFRRGLHWFKNKCSYIIRGY